jgi:hypothetical protein
VVLFLLLLVAFAAFVLTLVTEPWKSRAPSPVPPSVSSSAIAKPTAPEPPPTPRITGYTGAAACRECHPGEAALYARSGHHRTLWPAEPSRNPVLAWLDGKSTADPQIAGVTWSYHARGGKLWADRTSDGRTESIAIDYGFGSGTHGATVVAIQPASGATLEPTGIELRLSYFPDGPRLALTPGQESLREQMGESSAGTFGRPLGETVLQQCFGCHSTLTSTVARDRLEPASLIPNVSCERCHGPGRAHVEAARRGETELTMRLGHPPIEPTVEIGLCGECHRLPKVVPPAQIRPENPGIVRFQGVGLSMSSCYADGLSGLRCASCHDPHDRVSTDLAGYEAVCLSCHKPGSKQPACPVSPAAKCIGCHMPRRDIPGNGRFTDHWIRTPDRAAMARPAVPPSLALGTP